MASASLGVRMSVLNWQPRLVGVLPTALRFQLLSACLPRQLPVLALPAVAITLSGLGSVLSGLWDSILRAVPKKKTTHSRKRARQLAGKALKDVQKIVPCPSCGRPKRPHVLCEHCVSLIKQMWSGKFDEYKAKAKNVDGSAAQALGAPDVPSASGKSVSTGSPGP